jgi:hypothetical protein
MPSSVRESEDADPNKGAFRGITCEVEAIIDIFSESARDHFDKVRKRIVFIGKCPTVLRVSTSPGICSN